MITRIYADNYKCLVHFEFVPGKLNLLLGDNGSGKSSLFEVLVRLRDLILGERSTALIFAFSKTVWDRRSVQSFELEIDGLGGTFFYRLEIQHPPEDEPQKPQIKSEKLAYDGNSLFEYREGQVHLFQDDHSAGAVFPFRSDQSFLPSLESQNKRVQWFKNFIAGVNVFQLNPFAMELFSQQDEQFLAINGSNFVSWLRYLSQERPREKRESEERLADLIPGFLGFAFRTQGDRKGVVAEFSKSDENEYQLNLVHLSEGQRVLAMLYSILHGLVGTASVLCFDEPENFVSLPEVQPWLQELRDLVEERSGQALLISHHPEVIDYFAVDSAFRFHRPNGDLARVEAWTPEPGQILKPSEILARGG